jgi:parallel beta-helix repeat protein
MTSWPHLRRREWLSTTVVLAATVAVILAVTGGEASADHVSCGDTITVDTTLDSDLIDCPNNGIVIGANDITLDLDGHTVSGDGEPFESCGEREFCDAGLLNIGYDSVTLKKGAVRNFDVGALIGDARDNRVLRVSSKRNLFFGFVVSEAAQTLIRDSSGSRNPAPEGDGLGIFASHDIRVVDNSFKHNAQPGIHVAFGSNDNLIEGNLISHSGPGILIEKADRNRVRRNHFVRNSAGVLRARRASYRRGRQRRPPKRGQEERRRRLRRPQEGQPQCSEAQPCHRLRRRRLRR